MPFEYQTAQTFEYRTNGRHLVFLCTGRVLEWFNSHLNHLLEVVQDWYRSIFWMEVTEPYPQSNGGQN